MKPFFADLRRGSNSLNSDSRISLSNLIGGNVKGFHPESREKGHLKLRRTVPLNWIYSRRFFSIQLFDQMHVRYVLFSWTIVPKIGVCMVRKGAPKNFDIHQIKGLAWIWSRGFRSKKLLKGQ